MQLKFNMNMNEIRSRLDLSLALAKAEFKLRNEGSYLGMLWYLLNPLLTFFLLLLVFSDRLGNNIPHYPIYLLLGITMFNFFQQVTTTSTKIIHNHKGIIRSINFPYEALLGSNILRTLFSHLFEMIILIILLMILKIPVTGLVYYPVILVFFSIFVFGVSLMLFSLNVYFMDLDNIWVFVSRLIWLGTPIFYAVGGQKRLFIINLFNPLYYFITIARDLVVYARMPHTWMICGAVLYSTFFLCLGFFIFNRLKTKVAEMI